MISLNEHAKEYMQKLGWNDIILNVEEFTSWCAPPYKEIVVSFTNEDENAMKAKGFKADVSEVGKVYYPAQGVELAEKVTVSYVEYPWITRFEVEGIRPSEEKL